MFPCPTEKIVHLLKKGAEKPIKTIGLFAVLFLLFIGVSGCSGSDDFEVFSSIHGTVTDYQTGMPLENATVVLSPSGISQQTNLGGHYEFADLDVQQYTVTVQKAGYQPNRRTINVVSGKAQQVDIQLTPIPQN